MIIKAFKNKEEIDTKLVFTPGFKSMLRVTYECDECRKQKNVSIESLVRYNHIEKQYCLSCSIKLNGIVENRKQTCIDKYGVDNPMKVTEFLDKAVENNKYSIESQRNKIEDIRKAFLEKGYTLTSKNYSNRKEKLEYICKNGHTGSMSWEKFISGNGCNSCAVDKKRHTIEFIKSEFENENYVLLSKTYTSNKLKIKYKCPKGHIGKITYNNWRMGHRCGSCSHIVSKSELELFEIIKSYFPDAIHNDRKLISPLEIDILIPSREIGIEFCGLYWHSESNGKDSKYHNNKLQECQKKGYNLVTIFEDEWIYKKDIVISRLKNILGISGCKKVYARNCSIKEISASEKNIFLEENHIQGKDISSIKLGAFLEDSLVSVMTFAKGNIAKGHSAESGVFELSRFCSEKELLVVGIASKILKYFIKNYSPKSIFSYADKRWSIGRLYDKLGFKLTHISAPNYWYIFGDKRVHRFNYRKSVLKNKLEIFDAEIPEWKNMRNNGFERIFDCGNIRFDMQLV